MRRVPKLASLAGAVIVAFAFWETAGAKTLKQWQHEHHINDAGLAELKQLIAADEAKASAKAPAEPVASSTARAAQAKAAAPAAAGNSGKSEPPDSAAKSPWAFYLRQDWQDIGLLSAPTPTKIATGAAVSYSDDHIANNRSWAIHGTGAVVYRHFLNVGPTSEMTLFENTYAAYATVNRLYNSNTTQASKNVDTLAGGAAMEMGWRNTEAETANYLIARGGVVQDRIKDVTSVNATAAYIPVDGLHAIHYPASFAGLIGYRFDPQLLAQLASTTDRKNILNFSNHEQALRLGPQLSLIVFPYLPNNPIWSRLSGALVYHWWYEALYGRQQDWFKSSITYNLDDTGYLALTGSYQRGHTEDTGTQTNLFMVSLTGKLGP